jgi:hypothetical protein
VIFLDLNEIQCKKLTTLPKNIPSILLCIESPIYAPLSHMPNILFSKRWAAVMTWNRAYTSKNIYHFDFPFIGTEEFQLTSKKFAVNDKKFKGIVISTYKNDEWGLANTRDTFFMDLSIKGFIDIYGKNWPVNKSQGLFGPTSNKIATLQNYPYALVCENSIYSGFVTEKLADAIIAGVPSIYYGDSITATRKFPKTFIKLESLTTDSFLEARKQLIHDYDNLIKNVFQCRANSKSWCDSFLNTFMQVIKELDR